MATETAREPCFLFDFLSFAVEADREGGFVFVCGQWQAYTGMEAAETVGSGWLKALHPDDAGTILAEWAECVQSGTKFARKVRFRGVDGTYRWFAARMVPVPDSEGGGILRWMGSFTDIDNLVASGQALRRRAQELRSHAGQMEHKVRQRTAELERSNREISEMANKTVAAMENDRRALSKELHDSIGGTLAAIMYQMQARVEEMGSRPPGEFMTFERMIKHLQEVIRETRRISKQLRPSVLDDFGLAAAVNDCLRDFNDFYPHIKISRRVSIHEDRIPDQIKTVVYRAIQEALNNIGKHSHADRAEIRLRQSGRSIHLMVRDNGRGFDAAAVLEHRELLSGYGIHCMKERVEICKGTLRFCSEPGKGTLLEITVPVDPQDQLRIFA